MRPTQHPSNNAVLDPPPGATAQECAPLAITRVAVGPDGADGVVSFWQPSVDELRRLSEGRCVRLYVAGRTHPPLSVEVDGDDWL